VFTVPRGVMVEGDSAACNPIPWPNWDLNEGRRCSGLSLRVRQAGRADNGTSCGGRAIRTIRAEKIRRRRAICQAPIRFAGMHQSVFGRGISGIMVHRTCVCTRGKLLAVSREWSSDAVRPCRGPERRDLRAHRRQTMPELVIHRNNRPLSSPSRSCHRMSS